MAELRIPMAEVPTCLPVVLSREDTNRLFAACGNLRTRTVLMTTCAVGLRVSEVCALQLADIESAPDRMCLEGRQGKGGKDRYTLLFGATAGYLAPVLADLPTAHPAVPQQGRRRAHG